MAAVAGSRYAGRTAWIAPPNIDSTGTPRINHRNTASELLAETLTRNTPKRSGGPATPTPTTTRPPTTTPSQSGTNLSIGADSDGSSKATDTSYGNVRDANMSTYWSPVGSTGSISIKWDSPRSVSRINIREAAGAVGVIGSWRVINFDTGAVLVSGSGAGVITFPQTSLSKITFNITGSTGTPRVAEFETYAT